MDIYTSSLLVSDPVVHEAGKITEQISHGSALNAHSFYEVVGQIRLSRIGRR